MIAILAIISIVTAPVFAANNSADIAENPNQQWLWRAIGLDPDGRVYAIISTLSNKCVDNQNFSSANGNPTLQHTCTGNNAQMWVVVYKGNYFNLKNISTRKCIGVSQASSADGAKLVQGPCDNEEYQWFVNGGRIINKLTRKCMDVPNGTIDNIQLIQWTCN